MAPVVPFERARRLTTD